MCNSCNEMFFSACFAIMDRSVIWLQRRRDEVMERLRGGSLRKEEQYEYHIGRLRQDRVHIPRTEGQVGKRDVCILTC